jgi:Icc-related predicted phosphoesterase
MTRIYFASDIHGSDKCWLKFLSAAKYYEADVLMIGGDITGKFIVPIFKRPDGGATAEFLGVKRSLDTPEAQEKLKTQIANAGQYSIEVTPEEYAYYQEDQSRIDALFKRVVLERVEQWVEIADRRLMGSGVRCLVSGANDDYFEVDDYLRKSEMIEVPEGRVIDLDGFEMLSVGYANPTPWNCPRDISEEELGQRIDDLAGSVTDLDHAIFNLHVPPYGCGLDDAPKLDKNLRVVASGSGAPEMVPVGSTAVRDAILKYEPLLGLHGHIHESRGSRRLGSTTIVNPGSEYAEGILTGAIVDLTDDKRLSKVRLVSG